ncbi:hypothetical protein [Cellulosimicrobium marinum]|uniref:hypothetical protein n=1 Tax=Cellulosimicrobium marinum TaxID=1638992 RepID=UPI001E4ABE46|nr:hypothetical protein [Cellulosimicrobium marinum]MCB7136075.1 hypothetical protein [Cellulosimicrobium marinum]
MRRSAVLVTLAGALVGTVALGGCTADDVPTAPPPAPADALPAYTDLRADALDALGPVLPDAAWADASTVGPDGPELSAQPDGTCSVVLPEARADVDPATAVAALDDVPDALADVLDAHGFDPATGPHDTEHGGDVVVEAQDAAGWLLTVTVDGATARVGLRGPVDASPCDGPALAGT